MLRGQWIDRERLVFPLTQLPLAMMEDAEDPERRFGRFFKSRLLWLGFLLPLVLQVNEEILRDRRRLWNLHFQTSLGMKTGPADRLWLMVMAERYGFERVSIEALLKRVDIIPPSLALAQAAEESGWGTSRFVREGNAVFGQWTYSNTGSLVPSRRDVDKQHRVSTIKKITSGSIPEIADLVDNLYNQIITAGTHKAESIKVAEAAKVIENTQRDLNIALINELAIIFNRMGIDTEAVLKAAGSKWNFLPFKPGLVGGHCIGVDPYYLAQKAQEYGYHPEIILAGRRLNDGMGEYVSSQIVKHMIQKGIAVKNSSLLMLGVTFKENCPDVRNTKIVDVLASLKEYGINITIYDPWASPAGVAHEYGLITSQELPNETFDAVILGVAHKEFLNLDLSKLKKETSVVYDVKGVLKENVDGNL